MLSRDRRFAVLRFSDAYLWTNVRARQSSLKVTSGETGANPTAERRRPKYLFAKLTRCGACGGGYNLISGTLLGCATARNKSTCANRLNIRRDTLEATVLDGLRGQMMEPALFKEFCDEFTREVNRLRMVGSASLEAKRAELPKIVRQIRGIIEAIKDGLYQSSMKVEIEPGRGHLVHQARLAGRTTVQHVAGYERQRRHATLVATSLDISATLTDQAIDLFDRLVGAMFRKAEDRHARAFQTDARAINDKVRIFASIGAALVAGRERKQDGYDAILALMSWENFCTSVAEAQALARPEEFNAYTNLAEHYAGVRKWSPAFLEAFAFESVPAAASLIRSIELLREMNRSGKPLPKSAPTGFVRPRWAAQVMPSGTINYRYYELCVLSELRDRLRAGDVWVTGSRQYRSFEERLVSRETMEKLRQDGTVPVAVELDFDTFIAARRTRLHDRLAAVDARATQGRLPDVTLTKGVLKISPIEKSTPPEAEALSGRLYAMLPRIRIADLLAEVAGWTMFPDCFTHLRSGETAADGRILMAGLLADGLNLGLTRMAEACSIGSLGQLAWTSDWHIREETYLLAL